MYFTEEQIKKERWSKLFYSVTRAQNLELAKEYMVNGTFQETDVESKQLMYGAPVDLYKHKTKGYFFYSGLSRNTVPVVEFRKVKEMGYVLDPKHPNRTWPSKWQWGDEHLW